MKRISLLSTLLLSSILCSYVQARDYYHVPVRYRTRWSPYSQSLVSGFVEYNPNALTYKSSGLVNHRVEYSPYAFNNHSNGLIDRDVEYNPYALSFNNPSGLVSQTSPDYYNGGSVFNVVYRETCSYQNNSGMTSYYKETNKTQEQILAERKADIEKQKEQMEINNQKKAKDPSEVIREFLKDNNIPFKTNRALRIDGETVSINFNIENTNMIIKFWNSKAITEFAENDKQKKKIFDNYKESWKEYCLNNIGNSKKIYNIISDNKEEILEMLSFDNLNSDDVLYASAQK